MADFGQGHPAVDAGPRLFFRVGSCPELTPKGSLARFFFFFFFFERALSKVGADGSVLVDGDEWIREAREAPRDSGRRKLRDSKLTPAAGLPDNGGASSGNHFRERARATGGGRWSRQKQSVVSRFRWRPARVVVARSSLRWRSPSLIIQPSWIDQAGSGLHGEFGCWDGAGLGGVARISTKTWPESCAGRRTAASSAARKISTPYVT